MTNVFFKPYVGEDYLKGINNKKILVTGASHYCKEKGCKFFKQCTSRTKKNSSKFDLSCPHSNDYLSNCTIETVGYFLNGDENVSYCKFTNFMIDQMELANNTYELWNHIAFYNYVQFMLAGDDKTDTNPSDISERDYLAFEEVVKELNPDLIIVWGTPVGKELKRRRVNKIKVYETIKDYVFDLEISGKTYLVINSYHPSYGNFYDGGKLRDQLKLLL